MTEREGPIVWLDLTQQQLDDAYNQVKYAPNRSQRQSRLATNSARVRTRIGEPKHFAYGPSVIEVLDVYPTNAPKAPINIFIHVGAWRNGTAKDSASASELFVRAGAHSIVVDFI